MKQLAVIGAGSWGTALAIALASRFDTVRIWTRSQEYAGQLTRDRENARYLPGFHLAANAEISSDLKSVASGAEIILLVVPSAHLRATLEALRPHISAASSFVSATKGIEEQSLRRMSEVIADALRLEDRERIAVLSGPTFAREIASGEPAAVVIASERGTLATRIQQSFATTALRFYTSTDVIGVELGGALKNVIAIGAGVCNGLGLGSNSVAALVTRGLAEITRLAVELGGLPRTLSGLAGLGDLVLTATGDLSRNRFVGVELGRGRKLEEILAGMSMVAEGVGTCRAAYQLAARHGVDLPIVSKMYEVLYEQKAPRAAIRELMERPLTTE